ncbi:MAG: hypothetical protein E7Z85_07615 [Methanosphaera stadtmanae]|nr:hypothetical protein [Methanosphaera stadtmanae]
MNAILAAVLSFIIPGLGQAVSGEVERGIVLFVLLIIMGLFAAFIFRSWVVTLIIFAIRVYAAYDAYKLNEFN